MFPYLLASVIFLSIFSKPKKRAALPSQTSSIPGIIFTCKSIKLTDKSKFHDFLKHKITIYLNEKTSGMATINFIQLFLKIFEQINKTCYNKFINQKLNSTEKIVILILFAEISDSLKEVFVYFDNSEQTLEIFNVKINDFTDYVSMWMNASKELQNLPTILDKFDTTYSYP